MTGRLQRRIAGTLPLSLLGVMACHDLSGLTGKQQLPAGTSDPSAYHTVAGAMALYQHAVTDFQFQNNNFSVNTTAYIPGTFVGFVYMSGLLTDELNRGILGCGIQLCPSTADDDETAFDFRQPGNHAQLVYEELQGIRNDAIEGVGALTDYAPSASPALRGHLYALRGYAEVLLAEGFCSGIPLSTLDYGKDYTYRAASSTDSVYQDAITQLTTAITLADSGDSARIGNFARVGKGRALLGQGKFAEAALAVASVPDSFRYQFSANWGALNQNNAGHSILGSVSDREGENGLPYVSDGDPRTAAHVYATNAAGTSLYFPDKYGGATPAETAIVVADGIEARLIQAEAAFHAQQYASWLSYLNRARTLAATRSNAVLPPLIDPGVGLNGSAADSVRVSLLFRERAFDLFMTGHRQGDLRRLIRQYHRLANRVYPAGIYAAPGRGDYGTDVTVPIPSTENVNPLFRGCLSRGA